MTLLLAVAISLIPAVGDQSACAEIDALKGKVYTFRPTDLDSKGQAAKAKEMDAFWNLVKAQKENGAACLRRLLEAEASDGFFNYDGASLLASLDRSSDSLRVTSASVVRARLDDVDPGAYVALSIALAREGADITPLATRFLAHPADKVSAPAHALTIDRMFGVVLLFGSLSVDRADAALTRALDADQPRIREAAAMTMAFLMTEDGLRTLSRSPGVQTLPAQVRAQIDQSRTHVAYKPPAAAPAFTREQVLEYLRVLPHSAEEHKAAYERMEKFESSRPPGESIEAVMRRMEEAPPFLELTGHRRFIESAIATLTAEDLPALREWRRKAVHSLSDETLSDFFAYSGIINALINRLDLYREYRLRKRP
jgi:hypothetical protein